MVATIGIYPFIKPLPKFFQESSWDSIVAAKEPILTYLYLYIYIYIYIYHSYSISIRLNVKALLRGCLFLPTMIFPSRMTYK